MDRLGELRLQFCLGRKLGPVSYGLADFDNHPLCLGNFKVREFSKGKKVIELESASLDIKRHLVLARPRPIGIVDIDHVEGREPPLTFTVDKERDVFGVVVLVVDEDVEECAAGWLGGFPAFPMAGSL